jgi:hypothetical protein
MLFGEQQKYVGEMHENNWQREATILKMTINLS